MALNPPKDFDRPKRALWREIHAQLVRQGSWTDTDRHLLEQYVRTEFQARSARERAEKEPFVAGARGYGLVSHPGFKMARDAERDVRAIAELLLLTPAARKKAAIDPNPDPSDSVAGLEGLG